MCFINKLQGYLLYLIRHRVILKYSNFGGISCLASGTVSTIAIIVDAHAKICNQNGGKNPLLSGIYVSEINFQFIFEHLWQCKWYFTILKTVIWRNILDLIVYFDEYKSSMIHWHLYCIFVYWNDVIFISSLPWCHISFNIDVAAIASRGICAGKTVHCSIESWDNMNGGARRAGQGSRSPTKSCYGTSFKFVNFFLICYL